MDKYEVEIHGAKVKVTLLNDAHVIDQEISEMRSLVLQRPVMGLDIKTVRTQGVYSWAEMLLLCAGSRCLIVPKLLDWINHKSETKSRLARLLADRTVCFVGTKITENIDYWPNEELRIMLANTGVELGNLAARILKRPDLEECGLRELAAAAGVDIKPSSNKVCPSWNAQIFSEEEMKNVIYDVYTSYLVGNELLGML